MEDRNVIHARMMNDISGKYDKTEGSFFYDATKPGAIEFEKKDKEIEGIKEKFDVEKLKDEELTRFVYQRTGIERKKATKATGNIIISGQEGSNIKIGDMVSTDNLQFISLEEKKIDQSGMMTIKVECEEEGSIGNVPADSIKYFPITIAGLINVYNPMPIINGYNEESDSDLRQRYYDKLQRPGKAGNKYHYEEWAKEVIGVGDVRVVPRWNGILTVKVVVIDSNKQPASMDLIQNVFDHIEEERPFGADVTVISAIPKLLNISTTLVISEVYSHVEVIENIKKNITEYLKEIAFKATYISYAKIGSIIIDTEGVLDYQNLTVNGITTNIVIGNEEVAVIGTVTVA